MYINEIGIKFVNGQNPTMSREASKEGQNINNIVQLDYHNIRQIKSPPFPFSPLTDCCHVDRVNKENIIIFQLPV